MNTKTTSLRILPILALIILSTAGSANAQEADDCNNHFTGSDRARVKNRSPKTAGNQVIVKPMNLKAFYSGMHYRDQFVPDAVSQTTPIPKLETTDVTVEGYLVGCKYEHTGNSPDQDIHCEIAPTADWNGPHLVVEIPAGRNFCQPRKVICEAWSNDEAQSGDRHSGVQRIFDKPVHIKVKGFVFLDYHHATKEMKAKHEFSVSNGGRGIRKDKQPSKVMGIWEIHPVIGAELMR